MELTLSPQARRVLERLGSGGDLGRSIERLAAEAVRLGLRQCVEAVGEFEARYGSSFEQFATAWKAGRIRVAHSHRVERDYMEWEARTIEREELLAMVRELAGASSGGD